MRPEERLDRYARLAVEVGSNIGEGQDLWLSALPEHAPLVRAIARCAYERGARYVDVDYSDQHVRRARIELADEETLGWTPPWVLEKSRLPRGRARRADPDRRRSRARAARRPRRHARRQDPDARAGRAVRRGDEPAAAQLDDRGLPERGLGGAVFGEPDVERLWDAVASATRLDEPDPVDAWRRAHREARRARERC